MSMFNIGGGSEEFLIMYHESFQEGFGNHDSMLNNFYIDYNFVISNTFIFRRDVFDRNLPLNTSR